jgi:hypothetical protein
MVARRLLLLLALLMLMAALAAQISPPADRSDRAPERAPTAAPETPGTGTGQQIEQTIQAGGAGTSIIEAKAGDTLRLTVEGDDLATVEVEGLDQIHVITPDSPAVFELYLDREGTFPVLVEESGREIARIEVSR